MIAAALSLSLLAGLLPHHDPAAHPARAANPIRARVDAWTYEVRTDAFTGQKTCKLWGADPRSHIRMTYVSGALAFQFSSGLDTQAAIYRVDDGAPHAVRDDETTLVEQHVVMPDPTLNQGGLGLVFVPQQAVAGARRIAIRVNSALPARTISLGGFDKALAAAEAQGCAAGTFAQLDLPE